MWYLLYLLKKIMFAAVHGLTQLWYYICCETCNISCTLVGIINVDHSDVVEALPVGAAPTTCSFLTKHTASVDWAKTTARWDEKHLAFGIWHNLYSRFDGSVKITNAEYG